MLEKLAKVCKKFCCKSFCKLLQVFGAFILFYYILRVRVALCNNRQQAVNAVIYRSLSTVAANYYNNIEFVFPEIRLNKNIDHAI